MKFTTAKRQKIENIIVTIFNILDRTKKNSQRFIDDSKTLSNDEFFKRMAGFLNDDSKNFFLEVLPYESEPTLKDIKKAADKLGVPLEEIVYTRHDGDKDDPLASKYPSSVGYLYIKKMQQMLEKKNSYSIDISQRSPKTNQLTRDSKVARITDLESVGLTAFGADYALQEFLGPRADNSNDRDIVLKIIADQGFVTLKELEFNNIANPMIDKQTLSTVDIFFTGAGIKTDLIDPLMKLHARSQNHAGKQDRIDRKNV